MSLYLLAQVISVFSHPTLVNIIVAILASPHDATYKALMEEFKTDASETKITYHREESATEGGENMFKDAVLDYLNAKDTDLLALPALCLLTTIVKNKGWRPFSSYWCPVWLLMAPFAIFSAVDQDLAVACGLGTRSMLDSKALMVSCASFRFLGGADGAKWLFPPFQ